MSHSLLWRHCFAKRPMFIQATTECYHWNQYNEEIPKSMSVCNVNKNAYSSYIINSRIIMCISCETTWHSLPKTEATLKKYFQIILDQFF